VNQHEGSKPLLLAIGSGCAVLGFYHLVTFWTDLGKPKLVALLFTAVFIGFNISAGIIAGYVKQWYMKPLAVFIVLFSMFATVHTSYEQQMKYTAATADVSSFDAESARLDQEAALLQQAERDIRDAVERDSTEADYWRQRSWAQYDVVQKRLEAARQDLADIQTKQFGVQEAKRDAEKQKEAAKQERGVFRFVSNILGIDGNSLKVLLLIIPALFLDLLMPVCFYWGLPTRRM
jgi:prefoldin subunit 5